MFILARLHRIELTVCIHYFAHLLFFQLEIREDRADMFVCLEVGFTNTCVSDGSHRFNPSLERPLSWFYLPINLRENDSQRKFRDRRRDKLVMR